jgi:hypothetical protein
MGTKYLIEVTLNEDDPSEVLDAVIEATGDEDASVTVVAPVETSAVFGGGWFVKVEYNTDADGSAIPEDQPPAETWHGEFATQAEAEAWMDAYPDGDTDVYDISVMFVNRVQA